MSSDVQGVWKQKKMKKEVEGGKGESPAGGFL